MIYQEVYYDLSINAMEYCAVIEKNGLKLYVCVCGEERCSEILKQFWGESRWDRWLPGARPASGNVVSHGRSGQSPGAGIPGLAPSFPCSRGPPWLGRTYVGLGAAGRPTGTVPWLKTEAPLPPPRLCSAPRRRNGSPAPCGDVVSPRRGAADRATAVFAAA